MNEQKYPLLEQLHVLRTSALCSMRDRAFDLLPLYYADCSDGIVSGCRLTTNRESITVQPGIIRYDGFMYLLKEPMSVPYAPTDEYLLLKLEFAMPEENENFVLREVQLGISEELEPRAGEMELCRFKLKQGALLRTKYVDFFDRATEFDTVNGIHCPYAAVGMSSLSPEITAGFARAAMRYNLEPLDQCFCMEAMGGRTLSAGQIRFYLMHRLQLEKLPEGNAALYDGLCTVLQELGGKGQRDTQKSRRGRREVFVD